MKVIIVFIIKDKWAEEQSMVIVERECVDCEKLRKMYHNAIRCYECAKKRRLEIDRLRYKKRKRE